MARSPKSVDSFGPEVFEALLEGSRREVEVPLPYKKAVSFRQRANSLRAAMRSSNHEKYKIVAGVTVRIVWGKEAGYDEVPEKKSSQGVRFPLSKITPSKLIISPSDAEFGDALRKAGVTIKPLGSDPEPSNTGTSPNESGFGDDILSQYLKGET